VTEYQSDGLEFNFVTLTSHRKLKTPQATIAVFRHAWDVLGKRARRAAPGMKYVLIPERHESKKLHCHLLTSAPMPTRWYKDNSASCGLGYIAEEERLLTVRKAAQYMAKYTTKQAGSDQWPKGYRRVRTSRSWPALPALEHSYEYETEVMDKSVTVEGQTRYWQDEGYEVIDLTGDAGRNK